MLCAAVAPAQSLLGGHLSAANGIIVPPLLLAYGAGAWLDGRRALVALTGAIGLFGGFVLSTPTPHSAAGVARAAFFVSLLFAAPWFIGRLARASSRRAAAFRELAEQVAAESEQRERAAIAEERARIGHELQDIIAHSVSAMIIQAGGARRMMPSEPDRARESILAVERTGREALADLRRLLGMLRKDDDPSALAPQPGLDQVSALVESLRRGGLACDLKREGAPIDLTPGVDLVGYRVIEAALLAAARSHSPSATVTVRSCPEQLEIEIQGGCAASDLDRELSGIAHRVGLYDGSLRIVPTGGRRVRVARQPAARSGGRRMSIGVLIADDQALVRAGFRMILEAEPDLRVVAEAKDGAQAVEAARRARPDIVLMDIRMPAMDGLEATRRIVAARTRRAC